MSCGGGGAARAEGTPLRVDTSIRKNTINPLNLWSTNILIPTNIQPQLMISGRRNASVELQRSFNVEQPEDFKR